VSRTLLAVFAIALGVALGYAVDLITTAAVNELDAGVRLIAGDADLEIRGPRSGFAESVYANVASLPGVAAASPMLEVDAAVAGHDEPLPVLGIDVFRAASVQPALVPQSSDRFAMLRTDTVFLSPAAAEWAGVATGDSLRVQVGLQERSLRVAGTVSTGTRERLALMDIAAAQLAFARLGRITRIDLRLRPGADPDVFAREVAQRLPAGVSIQRPEASRAATASPSRAYRVNMIVLSLVALFTGALLVFAAQALAVVRRRSQFALLRVLGVTRGQLQRALLLEGVVIGGVGSAVGLAAGFGLAQYVVRHLGADLGSESFRGLDPTLALTRPALLVYFMLGSGVAVVASVIPARSAAHAAPALALRAGDEERVFAHHPGWRAGLIALGVGVVAALAPPVAGLPLFGYLAIALWLAGVLLLLPALTTSVLDRMPTPSPAPAQLALNQLRGTPGAAAVSLAAIVASVSLMVSMAIMVSSFRDALSGWLEEILPADAYLRAAAAGDSAYLDEDDQRRLSALPGLRRVEFLREQQLLLDPSRPRVTLLARNIDEADPVQRLPLLGAAFMPPSGAPPPVWVTEAMVDIYGYTPGRRIELPIDGRPVAFTVAGVWRDYARQQGAVAIARSRYVALTGDHAASSAALWLAPDANLADLQAAIARDVHGGDHLEFATTGEIRTLSLGIFDRTFAVTYALEMAAVVIGLLALSSSFGALVIARRREFGVLRHLGMTRRQIGLMLATEGLVVGGIGLLLGLVLGGAISVILIKVVNRQSFHFGMGFSVPVLSLVAFALVFLALATLTSVAAGRGAMSRGLVHAVNDDW
jgi:putative ABC transport system permease protein